MTVTAKAHPIFNGNGAVSVVMTAPPEKVLKARTGWTARGVAALRALAPYAAIELLLPGGSVLALLLWFYRRHQGSKTREWGGDTSVVLTRTLEFTVGAK